MQSSSLEVFEGFDAFGNEVYIEFGGEVDYYFID